jgi:ADP-ribose pyrophosphatase YjhB (NUDIX family)
VIAAIPEAPHPRVGVGVLLAGNQGRVLLAFGKLPPEAGCWSIGGGKVDFLEALEQCAIREAREEVGVEIPLRALLCVTSHCLRDKTNTGSPRRTWDKCCLARRPTVSRVKPARSAGSASTSCLRISRMTARNAIH